MTPIRITIALLSTLIAAPGNSAQRCNTEQYPLSAPTERFEDNGDGTVTDSVSRVMWMRCPVGQAWSDGTCVGEPARLTWVEAAEAAERVNASGSYFFNDWRVPALRDLAMIAERQCEDPRINLTVFPGTPADFFWTSSSRPADGFDDYAYALSFGAEGVQHRPKEDPHHVRLARTGQ
jgi:hypothetical protein